MSGWLDLTPLGLAPNQKHQALLGAPKFVHGGEALAEKKLAEKNKESLVSKNIEDRLLKERPM